MKNVELIQNWSRPPPWNVPGRSEQERIRGGVGSKVDLIALFKQLKDCPVEEGLDLLDLAPEGGIGTFIPDDSGGGQILTY